MMGGGNRSVDIGGMWEMGEESKMGIGGKEFKSGERLVKCGFGGIMGRGCVGL